MHKIVTGRYVALLIGVLLAVIAPLIILFDMDVDVRRIAVRVMFFCSICAFVVSSQLERKGRKAT